MPVSRSTHGGEITSALDRLSEEARRRWALIENGEVIQWGLSDQLTEAIDLFWQEAPARATSAVTNIITCLVCKVVEADVDVRYHREPKDAMPPPPQGATYFVGRPISEQIVAPWLKAHAFMTANSGWQTRTFERPRPYTLDYPENIGYVKEEFLGILHGAQAGGQVVAEEALTYLLYKQIVLREQQGIELLAPAVRDIDTIVSFFEDHFRGPYTQRGAARLPVLAIYAIYQCLMPETSRYEGKSLADLQRHEAADAQTGAIGDIEIIDRETGELFEAFEIKHDIVIDESTIRTVMQKFMGAGSLERYFILTTAYPYLEGDGAISELIREIRVAYEVQIIPNGILPTIRYFLRLLGDPSTVLPAYTNLLEMEQSIGFEHKQKWNEIVLSV